MSAAGRLLVIEAANEPTGRVTAGEASSSPALVATTITELPRWLRPGDVLVVNDAATLPASLQGHTEVGEAVELRLLGAAGYDGRFRAALLGAGDFRTRTECRPPPPTLESGALLHFGDDLSATVMARAALSARLLELEFDRTGAALWAALYRIGKPVQYAHQRAELPLYAVQTAYGMRPWAAEMPSAGWPLRWSLLLELRAAGVDVVGLTHAAGLSATGDPDIDAALPLPERFDMPAHTVASIARAHANGRRVVAVGTSVVRALEGSVRLHGRLRAGEGITDLVIDVGFTPRVVDGLLTGVHDPSESHFRLLQAFAPASWLLSALNRAEALGYRNHEFGDSMLLLNPAARPGIAHGRYRPPRGAAIRASPRTLPRL